MCTIVQGERIYDFPLQLAQAAALRATAALKILTDCQWENSFQVASVLSEMAIQCPIRSCRNLAQADLKSSAQPMATPAAFDG